MTFGGEGWRWGYCFLNQKHCLWGRHVHLIIHLIQLFFCGIYYSFFISLSGVSTWRNQYYDRLRQKKVMKKILLLFHINSLWRKNGRSMTCVKIATHTLGGAVLGPRHSPKTVGGLPFKFLKHLKLFLKKFLPPLFQCASNNFMLTCMDDVSPLPMCSLPPQLTGQRGETFVERCSWLDFFWFIQSKESTKR